MTERIGYLEVEGARLWYARSGAGPPVIFLHAGIADSRTWQPQVDAFDERFEVHVRRSRASGRALVEGIPGARAVDIAGVAHLPSLERPDELNHLVLEFLDSMAEPVDESRRGR